MSFWVSKISDNFEVTFLKFFNFIGPNIFWVSKISKLPKCIELNSESGSRLVLGLGLKPSSKRIFQKSFKTSWFSKNTQKNFFQKNRAPGKTGISLETRNFRDFSFWFFIKIKFWKKKWCKYACFPLLIVVVSCFFCFYLLLGHG